jgi:flagellar motor switch/type III secretory pathway protein FliN
MAVAALASPALPQQRPAVAAAGNVVPEKPHDGTENQVEEARWFPVLDLPCRLTVDLALPHFKVADVLHLQPGTVMDTDWRVTRDLPLRVNGTLLGWSQFEVVGERLAVRVTELA